MQLGGDEIEAEPIPTSNGCDPAGRQRSITGHYTNQQN
jgi:hypothetical protein